MPRPSIELDHQGLKAVLNSPEVAGAVHTLAADVAAAVASRIPSDAEVVVDDYSTDRAASSVTIRDARGRLWQVRDGVLTRAAASAGLEVTER